MALTHLYHGKMASAHTGAILGATPTPQRVLSGCPASQLEPQNTAARGSQGLRKMSVR